MRWDNLFDDLERQLERELAAEAADLQGEEERHRLGGLRMRDRIVALAAGGASTLRLTLVGGERIAATPVSFGRDWFSAALRDGGGQCIVPLHSIVGVTLAGHQVAVSLAGGEHPPVSDRLGLTVVLRDLCRRRRAVEIMLADATLRGTIDRVGADHLDVALHEPGSARRDRVVTEFRLVPFSAVVLVRI